MSSTVTLGGNPVEVSGRLPAKGQQAQAFTLVAKDLANVALASFAGKRKILNIFPSIDTPTCAMSVRKFNQSASDFPNAVVLCISADLPFAQARFCGAEGLSNVITLSTMRGRDFHKQYGVMIMDPPLSGLLARAVIVLDENDRVVYSQLVPEITHEPNYEAALAAVRGEPL